ncbi:MAG TPA: septal ring lytic transglycosylase RlpA family protein [Dehalococcoidia bacterium]
MQRRRRAPESAAGIIVLAIIVSGVLGSVLLHRLLSGPRPAAASALVGSATRGAITGLATFYADDFEGLPMADGHPFDMDDPTITAANTWPLGTRLLIRRAPGSPWDASLTPDERKRYFGAAIIVTVRDRGRFTHALDLSRAAFAQLGRPEEGVIRLYIEPVGDDAR